MAKNVNTATEPKIDYQPEKHYMGIRRELPFSGMFSHIDTMKKDLNRWFKENGIQASEPPILCYHCIDMRGMMDMEYAIPVANPLEGTEIIKPSSLPAGRYVSLIYTGGGFQGNKTLVEYNNANKLPIDRWDSEKGDNFAGRYEQFLTDPKIEPRKTKWEILVAMKLRDE
jgi:effector-binding domain-containing protein